MGNCITVHHNHNNKIASFSQQDENEDFEQLEATKNESIQIKTTTKKTSTTTTSSSIITSFVETKKKQKRKRKSVRFVERSDGDRHGGDEKGGGGGKKSSTTTMRTTGVRIRVLVTKNELREILRQHREESRSSSLEELVRAVKLRECRGRFSSGGRSDCEEGEEVVANGVWRPVLETILEDH